MSKIYFSLIIATNRNKEALKYLFKVSDSDTELIIIDSNYNNKTKDWLKKQEGYGSIIYAPVKQSPYEYNRDFSQALNTALLFSENGWIIRGDDNLEFKPDFFEVCRNDINSFTDVMDDTRFGIIGQKLWGQLKQEKWNDYFYLQEPSRFVEIKNPQFTYSFGIYPIDLVYGLNGYDERYDIGWGMEDQQFLHRALVAGYKIFFDREMMAYSLPHEPKRGSISITEMMYRYETPELNSGKIHAFNSFDMRQYQSKYLAEKDKFTI